MKEQTDGNLGARGESGSQLNADNMLMREALLKIISTAQQTLAKVYHHVSEITPQIQCGLCGKGILPHEVDKAEKFLVLNNEGFGSEGMKYTCPKCLEPTE